MPTTPQNIIVYLMLLTGILFLGLNFIAQSITSPKEKKSKRVGYVLIVTALLTFVVQQQYQGLLALGFSSGSGPRIILGGLVFPVFFISLVYYRIKQHRMEKPRIREKIESEGASHESR